MPNVRLKADLPSVNVHLDTVEIHTLIVFVILAVQILAVLMLNVKIMEMLQFASVLQIMWVIHMLHAILTLVLMPLVDQIPNVLLVDKDPYVDVFDDSLEIPTAGLAV